MIKPRPEEHVTNLVTGEFNEETLNELFHSEEYRHIADEIFERAVIEGNKHIDPQTLLWWQDAIAKEQTQFDEEINTETEKKDGGELYLIILSLFLIAYAIKYFIDS